MVGTTDPSATARGAYSYLNQATHSQAQEHGQHTQRQSFPLQQHTYGNSRRGSTDSESDIEVHTSARDFRVDFDGHNNNSDDDHEDEDDEDLEEMDDYAPLASSKRYPVKPASPITASALSTSRVSHPCKILATVFGTAMIVSLAFALLSLLHLNSNESLNTTPPANDTEPDNRVLKPPAGISVDDFKLSDFRLPPWDWDINSFLPINITNGPRFASIQWKNGEQFVAVDCPNQQTYRYHFPSFLKDEFRDHATATRAIEDLLPMGQEPYVFVLCPPGNNNANVVFREFDMPDEVQPQSPPKVAGTKESPQPLLDDVVMILVDAISRAKFTIEMTTIMEALKIVNASSVNLVPGAGGELTGHRVFDFEHYNVLGQNSPPNKAYIYSGQSIENINRGPKHWLWDIFEEQGFTTAHTDGECGGEQGIHDYTSGAITYEYSHIFQRIPAQYQMSQRAWCENHDMHVVSNIWGQSCTLPPTVNYDHALMGGMRWNTPYCAGHMAIHEHIMENLEGWLASTQGKRRFATYSFMDSHSPDHHHISFDKRFATFVQKLLLGQDGEPPLLSPRSTLVIMADHGLHYGRETYTFPGFIHHKIPPLFVALPNQLLSERPAFVQALEQNQNRILSHLDLHQTFLHLAYGDIPVDGNSDNYAEYMSRFIADGTFRRQFHSAAPNQTSFAQEYGRSLLLPIDEARSCHTAGIPHDFCAFQPFLDLDPAKEVDATFMRGALALLSKRMNDLAVIHHVEDVCRPYSLMFDPQPTPVSTTMPAPIPGSAASPTGTFDDIGTEDLVMESAYASAATSRVAQKIEGAMSETRVFYFMVRDRHTPSRKYSITMREDEVVMGVGDSITIQQMSAYAEAWRPCAVRISQGGKAMGKWRDVVKHFCVC
ncbi:hypothetical protein KVV02_002995 [Mortierella alpina]|uniref:Uncharacterized protein n=1 Tax=Mortierella alpina TaxID=64518 RepID=A0A9P8A5Q1_MORAP|nr:hypothetical protein KVV02_002995 [Mortierella alpina]